jgi:hypothetical protein
MKAQRRHDLRQSDLAKVIKQAPGFWQQSGGRWLLAAVAVLVIVILIRYRISSNRQAAMAASESLSMARTLIDELRSPRSLLMSQFAPPNEVAIRRRQIFSEATNAIGETTRLSDDRTLAAEALVARGDLCWALATLPEIPGAATQPALIVRDPKELLTSAAEAYRTVLQSYADVKPAAIAAHFSLAAIAENARDFEAAKQHYEAVKSTTSENEPYHQLADSRLQILPKLREPVILGKPASEPAITTTAPATRPIPPFIAAPTPATTRATTTAAPTAR